MQSVLFNPYIGPSHLQPLRARVELRAIVIKAYSAMPKFQHYWNLTINYLVSYPGLSWGGLTPLQRYSQCNLQP